MELTQCDNLTAEDWDRLRSSVLAELTKGGSVPQSIVQTLRRDLGSIRREGVNGGASVACEMTPVTEDYLDFLRQQIALNARGEGWTEVLSERLRRLAPYVGRPLLRVTVRGSDGTLTARLRPADYGLVHWELD